MAEGKEKRIKEERQAASKRSKGKLQGEKRECEEAEGESAPSRKKNNTPEVATAGTEDSPDTEMKEDEPSPSSKSRKPSK